MRSQYQREETVRGVAVTMLPWEGIAIQQGVIVENFLQRMAAKASTTAAWLGH